MNKSTIPVQYVIQPPNVPLFMLKHYRRGWEDLIQWSKREFQARLRYCAERGYWRQLKWLNENSSPVKILAELHGFRRMCANMTDKVWNELNVRDRRDINRAYELRDMLLR